MFNIKETVKRFEAVLDELDGLSQAHEALEDMNAELEDALMMIAELKPEGEDWREELTDMLEDLRALAVDYKRISADIAGVGPLAERLARIADDAAAKIAD